MASPQQNSALSCFVSGSGFCRAVEAQHRSGSKQAAENALYEGHGFSRAANAMLATRL